MQSILATLVYCITWNVCNIITWHLDFWGTKQHFHACVTVRYYSDVIMRAMASEIIGVPIWSTICSGADQRNIRALRQWPLLGAQRASNKENVSIGWCHYDSPVCSPEAFFTTCKLIIEISQIDFLFWHINILRDFSPDLLSLEMGSRPGALRPNRTLTHAVRMLTNVTTVGAAF